MNRRVPYAWAVVASVIMTVACGTPVVPIDPTRAQHQRPTSDDLHRLATTLAARGDLIRAEQYAALAVADGLPFERALPLLLSVCLRASRISAALAHAELGLRSRPSDVRLRYLVASMYVALDRPEAALRELDHVLADDPEHAAASRLSLELRGRTP